MTNDDIGQTIRPGGNRHRLPGYPLRQVLCLALALPGCAKAPQGIPQVDFSATDAYAVPAFRDDAETNVHISDRDFPLNFVTYDGQPVDLARYRGKTKVVLVVLRGIPHGLGGQFCPSCLAQTSSLLANYHSFTERGAEVLVVFPGPADRVGEFVQTVRNQTPGEPALPFPVLLDQDCSACGRLEIRADLAKPSTYILDRQGNVVYAYVGETTTDRPSVKAVLAHLDKAD